MLKREQFIKDFKTEIAELRRAYNIRQRLIKAGEADLKDRLKLKHREQK